MKSIIFLNKNGLRPNKHVLVGMVTKIDHAQLKDHSGWTSANLLTHGTTAQAVKHAGRHIFEVGDAIAVKALDGVYAEIELIGIRLVEVDRLTEVDFHAVGYDNRAEYMSDWGDVVGARAWFYLFRYAG